MILPYMLRPAQQTHVTESYVSSPPALTIFDERGDCFTLAQEFDNHAPRGEYAFRVLVNGLPTTAIASRIERRNGRIRAFTAEGWRHWNGMSFI